MQAGNVPKVACKRLMWVEQTYSLTKILWKAITKEVMEELGDITDSDYKPAKRVC